MVSYKIVVDSSANMHEKDSLFAAVPLKITGGGREFVDTQALDTEEMVSYLETLNTPSTTACPNVAEWLAAFEEAEQVFCIAITSTLSGSYNAARLAAEDYMQQYPERQVYVIDSLSTGPEMRLIAEKLQELIGEGLDFAAICEEITLYCKKTALLFSLESMKNLANNGRVSHLAAKAAGILGIRAVGKASERGDLALLSKCRGESKTLAEFYRLMKEMHYSGGKVRIDHCLNETAALRLRRIIQIEFPSADIVIHPSGGLCCYYAERGGMLVGFETD